MLAWLAFVAAPWRWALSLMLRSGLVQAWFSQLCCWGLAYVALTCLLAEPRWLLHCFGCYYVPLDMHNCAVPLASARLAACT